MATNKRSKLLLVDDDPSMIRLMSRVIERSMNDELDLESLTNSEEAMSRIESGGVDILLTDLEMPGVNGLELLKCAKRRNACTQVLFMTGHSTQEALLVALERGASDYLLKPVDQTELIELLKQSYQRQRRWKKALLGTWRSGHEPSTTAVG